MSTTNNTTRGNLTRLCAVRGSFACGDSPQVTGDSEGIRSHGLAVMWPCLGTFVGVHTGDAASRVSTGRGRWTGVPIPDDEPTETRSRSRNAGAELVSEKCS